MEQVRGAAFEALVREEFERSRDVLEGQLGEAPVLFAYPWMLGSDLSVRCAADAGFQAVFGVGFDFGRASRISGPMRAYGESKGIGSGSCRERPPSTPRRHSGTTQGFPAFAASRSLRGHQMARQRVVCVMGRPLDQDDGIGSTRTSCSAT